MLWELGKIHTLNLMRRSVLEGFKGRNTRPHRVVEAALRRYSMQLVGRTKALRTVAFLASIIPTCLSGFVSPHLALVCIAI